MSNTFREILARFPVCDRIKQYSPGQLPHGTENPIFYEIKMGYITIKVWPIRTGRFDMIFLAGNLLIKEWKSGSEKEFLADLDECKDLIIQMSKNILVMLGE